MSEKFPFLPSSKPFSDLSGNFRRLNTTEFNVVCERNKKKYSVQISIFKGFGVVPLF